MKKGKLLIPNEDRCTTTIFDFDEGIVLSSTKKVKTGRNEKDTITDNGLHSLPGNPIYMYNLTDFSASEVLDNHKSVLTSFGIQTNNEERDLPYIYWIPKMHKNPYKHRFIASSSWIYPFQSVWTVNFQFPLRQA